MTVERVTRFYLGEFQTTLTKGGKYINQLDPEEEKALIRCSAARAWCMVQHQVQRARFIAALPCSGVVFLPVAIFWAISSALSSVDALHDSFLYRRAASALFRMIQPPTATRPSSHRRGKGVLSCVHPTLSTRYADMLRFCRSLLTHYMSLTPLLQCCVCDVALAPHSLPTPNQARASPDRAGPVLRPGRGAPAVPRVVHVRVQGLHHLGRHRQDAGQGLRPHQDRGALPEGAAGSQGRERLRVRLKGLAEEARRVGGVESQASVPCARTLPMGARCGAAMALLYALSDPTWTTLLRKSGHEESVLFLVSHSRVTRFEMPPLLSFGCSKGSNSER